MFGPQFDYLRVLENTTKKINHPDNYIKEGEESLSERRIFLAVEYDDYEKQQLVAFKKIIKKYELKYNPQAQSDDVLLKFLYAGQFILSNSLELFKGHITWLTLQDPFTLTAKAKNMLQEGKLYLAGRDFKFRPTIVVNAFLFDFELFDSDSFMRALCNLLAICEDYMFYPAKVENIIIFIETKEINLVKFPFRQLQIIIHQLLQNFPLMLHKMFIFNPSKSLMATWDYISTLIDSKTLQKIELVRAGVFSPSANGFEASQVEERFGGGMPNVLQFWIPVNTINQATRNDPSWMYDKKLNYDREQPHQPSQLFKEPAHTYEFYKRPPIEPRQQYEPPQVKQKEPEIKVVVNYQNDMNDLFGMSNLMPQPGQQNMNQPSKSNIMQTSQRRVQQELKLKDPYRKTQQQETNFRSQIQQIQQQETNFRSQTQQQPQYQPPLDNLQSFRPNNQNQNQAQTTKNGGFGDGRPPQKSDMMNPRSQASQPQQAFQQTYDQQQSQMQNKSNLTPRNQNLQNMESTIQYQKVRPPQKGEIQRSQTQQPFTQAYDQLQQSQTPNQANTGQQQTQQIPPLLAFDQDPDYIMVQGTPSKVVVPLQNMAKSFGFKSQQEEEPKVFDESEVKACIIM